MTAEPISDPITEGEVANFVTKARAWCEQLTDREQALFVHIFRAAEHPTANEVRGYTFLSDALVAGMSGKTYPTAAAAFASFFPVFGGQTVVAPGTGGTVPQPGRPKAMN